MGNGILEEALLLFIVESNLILIGLEELLLEQAQGTCEGSFLQGHSHVRVT